MTGDPFLRLVALNSTDAKEARQFFNDAHGRAPSDTQDVVDEYEQLVEAAICNGDREVELDIVFAEQVAVILKERKRARGRQRLDRLERLRNEVAISLARQLKREKIAAKMKPGQAEEEAAREAAELAGRHGCRMAWTTILDRMGK